jgi:MGT family glycosyltransferase
MSKHFLFVMWEGGGTVAPELCVAEDLIRRGHRVTVLADDTIETEARTIGAGFVGYEHAPNRQSRHIDHDVLRDWEVEDPAELFQRAMDRIMCGPALGVARDVVALHEADPVDCVATCYFLFGAMIGAERAGVPCAVLCPNVDFRAAPGRPGFGAGVHPLEGPEGEARDAEIWAACRSFYALGQPNLDRARESLGLPTLTHPWDEYDRADRVILLTSRHFEYPYELQPGTVFAGPMLGDPYWNEHHEPDEPKGERPLVLVSLGSSFQNQIDVYRRILAALGRLPVEAIVTLGNVFEPSDLEAPANVRIVRSAAHGPLLERAALMVSHCGHGSVMKALAAGVPLLCLPLGRDQHDNAARVTWHEAGLRLDSGASSEDIERTLARLLEDASFRANAARLGRAIRSEIEEEIAVNELEKIARAAARSGSRNRSSDRIERALHPG